MYILYIQIIKFEFHPQTNINNHAAQLVTGTVKNNREYCNEYQDHKQENLNKPSPDIILQYEHKTLEQLPQNERNENYRTTSYTYQILNEA